MHQHDRQICFLTAETHAADLVGSNFAGVNERATRFIALVREPRLDDKNATRPYMPRHASDRATHPIYSANISDRAEQTRDDVVARAQIEIGHVGARKFSGGIFDS